MKQYFEKIYKKTQEEFFIELDKKLKNQDKELIVTANPETFMMASSDSELNDLLLDKLTTIVPDGIGIVKAARMVKYDVAERIPGVDITEELFKLANKYNKKICILGSKQEVLDALKNVLNKKYPNLRIGAFINGYNKDKDKDMDKIAKDYPDIILIALGMGQQEKLAYKHINKFKKGIFVGVGGSLDVLSGLKKRAPKIFIRLNLEWLYRLCSEPTRFKRFYNNNVKFIFKVKKLTK